ncbi:MAG: phosphatidate cytidylyltransferase, partial [Flavobacteriales bacterium]|nr:phosphatidate cytidylyltransferase [Flavobacteriales bacterium]
NWFLILIGIILYSSFGYAAFFDSPKYLLTSLPFIMTLLVREIFKEKSNHFKRSSNSILGLIYVALPISLLSFLAVVNGEYEYELVLGYFLLLWANDTGAYIFGVSLGRNKLFERISAKKTWEGTIGGAITTIGVAYGIHSYTNTLTLQDWIIVSLIVVVWGSLGDLVESSFKRTIKVKDSGSILPGHGGVLDRFDGLLISLPVVVTYLYLFA